MTAHLKKLFWLLVICGLVLACKKNRAESEATEYHDFEKIQEAGELTVLTLSSSTSYFLYREQPMGFHYDIAKQFCKDHDLELKVKVANNRTHLVEMLEKGEGDLVAYPLLVLNELKDSLIYCGVNTVSHQVLVQRNLGKESIKDVTELIGKEVTVPKDSKFYERLNNLNAELGGGIGINTNVQDSLTTEDLIEMVANGEIDYTITDEYVGKLNKTYFRNINIDLAVSFDQRLSWAVTKNSVQLADTLNAWYAENVKAPVYTAISKKYFELSKQPFSDEFDLFKGLSKGQISPYDNLFKQYAKGTPYDWQLLASISYQESRFKNGLVSWAGAAGIMGIMPATAQNHGVDPSDLMDPEVSISLSIKIIRTLDKVLSDIEDVEERLKFILAAYNGGIGHVMDVRALAKKYGDDDQVWDGSVRKWITRKRDPQYYNDPVCKSGYFRGTETLNYVDEVVRIMNRFKKETE